MKVVGIILRNNGIVQPYSTTDTTIQLGDSVLVESRDRTEVGVVKELTPSMSGKQFSQLPKLLKKADATDLLRISENEKLAIKASNIVKEKVNKFSLDMKVVRSVYAFDRSKVLVYFTSDDRVDFRELVRELASTLKTRIELRQIGVRDEARILGGIGPCGRILCCTSYLGNFDPVSIKMAKDQGLSLNPVKISGVCGRFLCCLKNEQEAYVEARKVLPEWGVTVETPDGVGRVTGLNVLSKIVKVRLPNVEFPLEYAVEDVKLISEKKNG
ncbi:MAG: signal peptidase [Streptococcaceae bacterium]|jgi:cell fate regulator YaaT (PSP1 superfamily)|nr:signal peptidase [Streptococcaceae bacterium]